MKVGIVGLGFVGHAVSLTYDSFRFFDPAKAGSVDSLIDLLDSDVLFICVPTPSLPTGECDTTAVVETLELLSENNFTGLVIMKSTAPFETYARYKDWLRIVHIPEFLRAASADEDYRKSKFMIIGADYSGDYEFACHVINRSNLKCVEELAHITLEEACLVKYFENSFLATKVSLMNEFHFLCKKLNVNWNNVINALTMDERIGADHTEVPGPDGTYGWGGHCFPKDTKALLKIASDSAVELPVLQAAVESNSRLRDLFEYNV